MSALTATVRAGAWASSLAALLPAAAMAQTFEYSLVQEVRLDTGEIIDMPSPVGDFPRCIYQRSRTEIGRKIAPGLMLMADGTSPGGTVVGVRCEEHKWGMGD